MNSHETLLRQKPKKQPFFAFIMFAGVLAALLLSGAHCYAQDQSDQDLAKQSQNPIANMISLPLQNNTFFGLAPMTP